MKTSLKGKIALVVSEGIVDTPYLDAATPPVWTIGIGITKSAGWIDPEKHKGKTFSIKELFDAFDLVLPVYEKAVSRNVKVSLTQQEFDALVHFVYNVGEGNFKKSNLLKNLNAGNKNTAFNNGFHGWLKPASLRSRRDKEKDIALKGNYGSTIAPLYGVNSRYLPVNKGSVDVSKHLKDVPSIPTPSPRPTTPIPTVPTPVPEQKSLIVLFFEWLLGKK